LDFANTNNNNNDIKGRRIQWEILTNEDGGEVSWKVHWGYRKEPRSFVAASLSRIILPPCLLSSFHPCLLLSLAAALWISGGCLDIQALPCLGTGFGIAFYIFLIY
jgi:hypothetical protein